MAEVTNGNGNTTLAKGFQQVMTYLIGAGVAGIIAIMWMESAAIARIDERTLTQGGEITRLNGKVDDLSRDVDRLGTARQP